MGRAPGGAALTAGRDFGLGIARMSGTVVVTAHGELDAAGCAQLRRILEDLIDGQGNLSIVVDLDDTWASGVDSLPVFEWALERSARRGGRLVFSRPPENLCDALLLRGMGGLASRETSSGGHRVPDAASR